MTSCDLNKNCNIYCAIVWAVIIKTIILMNYLIYIMQSEKNKEAFYTQILIVNIDLLSDSKDQII